MKPIGTHNYFVYIVTKKNRIVLYTGVTNDLERRLYEHEKNSKSINKTFTGRYNAYFLIFKRYRISPRAWINPRPGEIMTTSIPNTINA